MRFPFNEQKTAQAAGRLLSLGGGRLPYMVLIKLLYLADRAMLVKHGLPITGDRLVAMKHGPVLSRVLDLINNGPDETSTPWFDYVNEPTGYFVTLKAEAPIDELSRVELELLDGVFAKYGRMDRWELRDLLHKILPEWKDPGSSSSDIDPEEILKAASWDEDRLQDARMSAEEARFLSRVG